MTDNQNLCGWVPNPRATAAYVETLPEPQLRTHCKQLITDERRDVALWLPLLNDCRPQWRRGAQGIGDCVSWGAELACTMLMAVQFKSGTSTFLGEAATEPIYGGGRCEIDGSRGGWSDGSYGAAAAKWVRDWGVLLRLDYSEQTGNAEHDLKQYSSDKAKDWGHYGCGGENDGGIGEGTLDKIARAYPVKATTLVTTVEEAAAAIMNGYPVTVASGVGYGNMRRNSEGVVRRSGSWSHQMMFGGVRWVHGEPQLRQFQSWGKSCSGPDPGIAHEAVSWCSWWTRPEDAARQLRQDDSFAFSNLVGFPPQKLDWLEAWSSWG